ncbi:two-component system response regulator RegA [Prosthecobacter fusiformis]|uniref:Two-component system response regulator RegA n=1 Tax=Prosthecobacter fusiformis TaxID=48464 RepID=A0A4R7SQ28_9BACT|nr:response regulator [Prosthecobacter fusiformis]TDU81034.1 two-component system response regulator RegA [Prosthecobacter fusiformis]
MTQVLLIEDDDSFRTTLAMALKRRGCEVFQAADAASALIHARASMPGAIVLDMRLGSSNGMLLISELRHLLPQVRLIILTGYGSIPSALESVRLGADDYLLKPASADQVLAAILGKGSSQVAPMESDLPSLARLEWEHIQRVLHDHDGNISHAAAALGIDRRTLQRKLGKMPPLD